MKSIRILIVEDEPPLLELLKTSYREKFKAQGFDSVTIEESRSVDEARKLAKDAASNPYDLVSLDVNLGDTTLTGLDVLSTLKRYQSAWMVALLTGVETDGTVDKMMGKARGESLRKQLRRDAYSRFPAERLLVVEKPVATTPPKEAETLLQNRLVQIAAVYEEVSRLRYMFRPIEIVCRERIVGGGRQRRQRQFVDVSSTHWEIRFNCGDMRTLPDRTWFKTLHHLLSMDRNDTLSPEEALGFELPPQQETPLQLASTSEGDAAIAKYFTEQGIAWAELAANAQDDLIRAALSFRLKRYIELRGYQEDKDGIEPSEEEELERLKKDFGPLLPQAEAHYQKLSTPPVVTEPALPPGVQAQNDLHRGDGNYDQPPGRWGADSPAAQLFRARKKRACDYLRENGFREFAEHIEFYVQPTGASWSYNPPAGIEWTV